MSAWIETLLVALVGGGGVKVVDALLARRDKDREHTRVSQKDENEAARQIREDLRKHNEMLAARAKAAEEEAQKLREQHTGPHAAISATTAAAAAAAAVPGEKLQITVLEAPFVDPDLKMRQLVRLEVERVFRQYRNILHRLVAMADFSIRRAREERGLPNPPQTINKIDESDPENDG